VAGRGQDPLGTRALFWLPVEERTHDVVPTDVGGDHAEDRGSPSRARATGKRALYSGATPAGEHRGARPVPGSDPLPARGIVAVACSSCGDVRRVGLLRFAVLHLPVAAWVPGRRFDRWMTCPSCRRRTWVSVTLTR
jgi:hypothetical protein